MLSENPIQHNEGGSREERALPNLLVCTRSPYIPRRLYLWVWEPPRRVVMALVGTGSFAVNSPVVGLPVFN